MGFSISINTCSSFQFIWNDTFSHSLSTLQSTSSSPLNTNHQRTIFLLPSLYLRLTCTWDSKSEVSLANVDDTTVAEVDLREPHIFLEPSTLSLGLSMGLDLSSLAELVRSSGGRRAVLELFLNFSYILCCLRLFHFLSAYSTSPTVRTSSDLCIAARFRI